MQRALALILSAAVLASSTSLRGTAQSQRDPNIDTSDEYGLTEDDGRKGTPTSSDESDEAEEMAKSVLAAAGDHIDSKDTPDDSDSFVQFARKITETRAILANSLKQDPDAFDDDAQSGDKDSSMGDEAGRDRFLLGEEMSKDSGVGEEKSSNEEGMSEDSKSLLQHKKDSLRAREIAAILLKQDPKADDEPQISDYTWETAVAMGGSSDSSLPQLPETDETGDSGSVGVEDGEDIDPSAQAAEEQPGGKEEGIASRPKSFLLDKRTHATAAAKSSRQDPNTSDEYEYGDRDATVNQGDSSDFSVRQYLADDDGREGSSTSDDGLGDAEVVKSNTPPADDHFDSEDTPDDSDSFAQMHKKVMGVLAKLK